MHQHQHQHTHQHMYPIPPPFTPGSLIPSPAPHMFEKIPKPFESPFYPRAGPSLPGYPTVSPLLHPTTPGHISSGVAGAFQPKGVASSLHPSAVMFASLHGDREKLPLGTSTNTPLPTHKKSGKWCAMHVKIAWEIHQHQQKQSEVGKEGMTSGHLFPGNSLRRPTDISSSSSFLGSHSSSSGSLLDSSNSHPGANQLNLPSFPRPSPYSNIGSFGGLGGSPFASSSGRDVPRIPGITPPHEWNRIHRTPPTFPPSSTWSRPDDREKENLLALERRREEERERERRSGERHRSLDERAREHEGAYHSENRHSLSRSRSRSPLVNGRVGSAKSDGSYDKPGLKIKEERREDDPLDKMRNDYLLGSSSMANPLSATLIERARMLSGSSYPLTTDRVPAHSALWNSVDRLQFQQDMERERERMLSRFQTPLSIYEQDRLRKEDLLLQEERLRYLERFPMFERERLSLDPRGLPPSMRHHEHLGPGHFPRTVSPMLNHTKGGSPVCAPGAPPPLIPSTSRSHSNSPAVGKQKMSNESDKTFSNSTDQDSHPR
ncbi:hypothetical protein FSP39_010339 [Pinctada imbricata]|uniref:Uncharacterized protein n=1 Tax=Pinctada imbricata TaxID=66713 RepID=A0AA88XD36_PINIB|nr:hypothetical protein FSP39_010339 [Pinctada imbricata]